MMPSSRRAAPQARGRRRAFTLVELMIVVAIVGVLAALAVYGVQKYVANAKTAEARTSVGQIAKGVQAAYENDEMTGQTLPLEGTASSTLKLCPSAAAVPSTTNAIQGRKYQSKPSDWSGNWTCVRFSMASPQYYQYNYVATGTGDTGSTVTALAQGDLDGDGTLSTFSMLGKVAADDTLTFAPAITENKPSE